MRRDSSVAAAVLNPPFSIHAQRVGLRDMGTIVAALGLYQGFVSYVMRAWARANAETLVAYIAAYLEGLRWARDPANRPGAIALYAERLALPRDIAAEIYAAAVDPAEGLAADAAVDLAGLATVLRLRADFVGKTPAAAETYLDLSYYRGALAERAE